MKNKISLLFLNSSLASQRQPLLTVSCVSQMSFKHIAINKLLDSFFKEVTFYNVASNIELANTTAPGGKYTEGSCKLLTRTFSTNKVITLFCV